MPLLVLVVDDDAAILALHSMLVSLSGGTCVQARDGNEALEVLRHQPVDVLFTDVHMPGMGGLDLIQEMRASWPDRRLYTIVATGLPDSVSMSEAECLGIKAVLRKPVDREQVGHHLRLAAEGVNRDG